MCENLCTFEGKILKTVYCPDYSCHRCYFQKQPIDTCSGLVRKGKIPSCNGSSRKDGRDVIFVEISIDKIIDLD